MDVAVITEQCLAPVPGGTGRYSREVAAALARRPGVDVTGWTAWHRDTTPALVTGVTGPRRLAAPRRPLTLAWEHGTGPRPGGRPDVVFAPTLLAPPRGRVPLVVTVHDAVPWTHPEHLTPRGVQWHRTMAARVAAGADALVVPTRAVAEALAGHVDARRVEVVGEGVAEVFLAPVPAGPPAGFRLPAGGHLVSVATVEPRKGLDVLIAALADPAGPDLPLVVVGQPGWGGVDPLALARDHGLREGRVLLAGRLSDEDLVRVLASATALVVPSRAEGFGLPVLEGMAVGTPVVTSQDPALVEVGGDAVVTVPVGDAHALAVGLSRVVGDAGLRAAMVERGAEVLARHTWSAAAATLEDLFRDVAGRGVG